MPKTFINTRFHSSHQRFVFVTFFSPVCLGGLMFSALLCRKMQFPSFSLHNYLETI